MKKIEVMFQTEDKNASVERMAISAKVETPEQRKELSLLVSDATQSDFSVKMLEEIIQTVEKDGEAMLGNSHAILRFEPYKVYESMEVQTPEDEPKAKIYTH